MATLSIISPSNPVNSMITAEIDRKAFTIGRYGDFKTPWGHNDVSRLHCAILENGSDHTVRDLNSFSGTVINGESIGNKERNLSDGDKISLGNHVVLVYRKK